MGAAGCVGPAGVTLQLALARKWRRLLARRGGSSTSPAAEREPRGSEGTTRYNIGFSLRIRQRAVIVRGAVEASPDRLDAHTVAQSLWWPSRWPRPRWLDDQALPPLSRAAFEAHPL